MSRDMKISRAHVHWDCVYNNQFGNICSMTRLAVYIQVVLHSFCFLIYLRHLIGSSVEVVCLIFDHWVDGSNPLSGILHN